MSAFEGILDALDNVRANPLRSFLTMLGVIIGVFSVVTLVSIGEGAKKYVTDQFAGLGTNILIITPGAAQTSGGPPITGLDTTYKLTIGDTEAILTRCPALSHVSPVILATSTVKRENRLRNRTTVIGTNHDIQRIRNFYVEFGQFLPRETGRAEKRVCVLGRDVARDLFPLGESPLGQWVKVGGTPYRVIGVMERKGYSLGFNIDAVIFIPVHAAQELFDTDELFEVLAQVRSSDAVPAAKEQIRAVLMRRHDRHEDFTITDQRTMIEAFEKILGVLTYALAGIAAISLLVGGIGIMNIMLTTVTERTKEIGVRRALGATQGAILRQFLVETVLMSVAGGVVGILVGAVMAQAINVFAGWQTVISLGSALVAFGVSGLVGIAFGLYPARRAAQMDPIAALRFE